MYIYICIFLSRSVSSALVLEANHRIVAGTEEWLELEPIATLALRLNALLLGFLGLGPRQGLGALEGNGERNRETFGFMISAFFEHQSDRCVAFLGASIFRSLFWVLGKFPVMAALRCLVEEDVEG